MKPTSLANQLLIAMPALADPNFARTVTFLCEHASEGAMGIIINRLTDLTLREVFEQLKIPASGAITTQPVYYGGPVQGNRGFVLHEPLGQWEASLRVTDTLAVTTSRDVLEAIAEDRGPDRYLVALGYAGWAPGQLERELGENAWLSGPAERAILFELPPERRWRAAAERMGVDLTTLSGEAGHA
jgi:putative transcriptional regulator